MLRRYSRPTEMSVLMATPTTRIERYASECVWRNSYRKRATALLVSARVQLPQRDPPNTNAISCRPGAKPIAARTTESGASGASSSDRESGDENRRPRRAKNASENTSAARIVRALHHRTRVTVHGLVGSRTGSQAGWTTRAGACCTPDDCIQCVAPDGENWSRSGRSLARVVATASTSTGALSPTRFPRTPLGSCSVEPMNHPMFCCPLPNCGASESCVSSRVAAALTGQRLCGICCHDESASCLVERSAH